MRDRLLLLHGLSGGKTMGRFSYYTNPITHSRVKRRTRKHGMGELGLSMDIARKGITASVDAVKSVGMVSLIAAGGAIATDFIFTYLLANSAAAIAADPKKKTKNILGFEIDSMETDLAKAAVGIAGGVMIGKFAKKPQLGAAFAIGAVALAIYNIASRSLKMGKYAPTVSGMGYVSAERAGAFKPAHLGASRITDTRAFQPMPVPAVAGYGSF
jgi:hypothetical protein